MIAFLLNQISSRIQRARFYCAHIFLWRPSRPLKKWPSVPFWMVHPVLTAIWCDRAVLWDRRVLVPRHLCGRVNTGSEEPATFLRWCRESTHCTSQKHAQHTSRALYIGLTTSRKRVLALYALTSMPCYGMSVYRGLLVDRFDIGSEAATLVQRVCSPS